MRGWLLTHRWQARNRSLTSIAFVAIFGLALAPASAQPIPDVDVPSVTNVPATLSFAELRQGVLSSIVRIKALDAEFTQLSRFSGSHEMAEGSMPFMFYRQAFKGDRRYGFTRILEHPHHGNLKADISAAPGLGEHIRTYDGVVQRCYKPYGISQARVYAKKDPSADAQVYAHVLSLPIADDVRSLRSEVRAWAGWPPDVYDRSGLRWVVEPMCQSVDGHVCHVISEPTLGRREWIDPATGYVKRFQEVRESGEFWEPAGEDIETRIWNSDFKEVAPGIWLPFRSRSVTYAVEASGQGQPGAIVSGNDVVALRLAVNEDVPDSLFELRFQPGTVVVDQVRNVAYLVGNNGEEIDPESDAGRQLFEGNLGSRPALQWRPSIWLLVNAAVVMSLAALVAMRLLRNRRQSPGRS